MLIEIGAQYIPVEILYGLAQVSEVAILQVAAINSDFARSQRCEGFRASAEVMAFRNTLLR